MYPRCRTFHPYQLTKNTPVLRIRGVGFWWACSETVYVYWYYFFPLKCFCGNNISDSGALCIATRYMHASRVLMNRMPDIYPTYKKHTHLLQDHRTQPFLSVCSSSIMHCASCRAGELAVFSCTIQRLNCCRSTTRLSRAMPASMGAGYLMFTLFRYSCSYVVGSLTVVVSLLGTFGW